MGIDMRTGIVFTRSFENHHFGPYIMIVYLNLIKSNMVLWSEALIVPYTLWQMKDGVTAFDTVNDLLFHYLI